MISLGSLLESFIGHTSYQPHLQITSLIRCNFPDIHIPFRYVIVLSDGYHCLPAYLDCKYHDLVENHTLNTLSIIHLLSHQVISYQDYCYLYISSLQVISNDILNPINKILGTPQPIATCTVPLPYLLPLSSTSSLSDILSYIFQFSLIKFQDFHYPSNNFFKSSLFLSSQLNLTNIEIVLIEIIQNSYHSPTSTEAKSFNIIEYLCQCFLRCYYQNHLFDTATFQTISNLILNYNLLVITSPTLFGISSENSHFINDYIDCLPRICSFSNLHLTSSVSNHPIFSTLYPYFSELALVISNSSDKLQESMKYFISELYDTLFQKVQEVYLHHQDYILYQHIILFFLEVPFFRHLFIQHPHFINNYLSGSVFEKQGLFGIFFHLTVLPDCPSVSHHYFPNPLDMSQSQRNQTQSIIQDRLTQLYDLLYTICFHFIFDQDELSQISLFSWFSTAMLVNSGRSKLIQSRSTLCSDGFFLNLNVILLRLFLYSYNTLSPSIHSSLFSPTYFILPTLIDYFEQTRLSISNEDINNYIDHIFQGTPQSKSLSIYHDDISNLLFSHPSLSPQSYSHTEQEFLKILGSVHGSLLCDHCRTGSFSGNRYRCLNCLDYDICSNCNQQLYLFTLGFTESQGVLFNCPYHQCSLSSLTENQLVHHIISDHSEDMSLVNCPICYANNHRKLLMQPQFNLHLNEFHPSRHDPFSHLLVEIPYRIPQHISNPHYRKNCILKSIWPIDHQYQKDYKSNSSNILSLSQIEKEIIHHVTCCHCQIYPIRGTSYLCLNCPQSIQNSYGYIVCADCYKIIRPSHPLIHSFIVLHYPLTSHPDFSQVFFDNRPMSFGAPSLYPISMCGLQGFSIFQHLFMLAFHSLHLGYLRTCGRFLVLLSQQENQSNIDTLSKKENLLKLHLVVESNVLHPYLFQHTILLYGIFCKWIISYLDPFNHNNHQHLIPLSVALIPEYFIDDLSDMVNFIFQVEYNNVLRNVNEISSILHLFLYFLAYPSYLKNPHLKNKLIESFSLLYQNYSTELNNLISSFHQQPVYSSGQLLQSLFTFFCDIEKTDHDQFHDKYQVRSNISNFLNCLLQKQCCQDNLNILFSIPTDFHYRFFDFFLNDLVFLLEEILEKALSLHKIEKDLETNYIFLSNNTLKDLKKQKHNYSRMIKIIHTFIQNYLYLLITFSSLSSPAHVLISAPMIERVLGFINLYVSKLYQQREQLRLKSNFEFDSDFWLLCFISLYHYLSLTDPHINLSQSIISNQDENSSSSLTPLLSCIINDSQFNITVLKDIFQYLSSLPILRLIPNSSFSINDLSHFINCLEKLLENRHYIISQMDEEIDIPSEFLDPIMNTLMSDPVILPSSGLRIDRSVIYRHLLSTSTDPFNRSNLTMEMCQPDQELKKRIEEWKVLNHFS